MGTDKQPMRPIRLRKPILQPVTIRYSYKRFTRIICLDTARYNVNIWPLPNTFAGNDTFICRGTPMQLRPSGAVQYTWQASPDLSCTQCATPLINPANNTAYIVTGVSDHGCVKSDTVQVRVRQPFTMQVQPGDTLCAGEQRASVLPAPISINGSPQPV